MSSNKIEFLNNEHVIETWSLNCATQNGGKFNGKCTVTDHRIIFELLQDNSITGILFKGQYFKRGSFLYIDKSEIKNIEIKKGFFGKKVILTLQDNHLYTFDRGIMNIDDFIKALNL